MTHAPAHYLLCAMFNLLFFLFTAAEKSDPANADVKRELARVQKAIDDALKREKNVYSKMFG